MSLLQWSVNNTRRREGERESQFRPKLFLPRSEIAGLFRRSRDGAFFINGKFCRCPLWSVSSELFGDTCGSIGDWLSCSSTVSWTRAFWFVFPSRISISVSAGFGFFARFLRFFVMGGNFAPGFSAISIPPCWFRPFLSRRPTFSLNKKRIRQCPTCCNFKNRVFNVKSVLNWPCLTLKSAPSYKSEKFRITRKDFENWR